MMFPKPTPAPAPRYPATIGNVGVSMGTLRAFVIVRDGGCVARLWDPAHVCRDRFGHDRSQALISDVYSLEHVRRVHSPHDGRHHNERHTVALCYWLNGSGPALAPPELRQFCRERLRQLHPECNP